MSELAIRPYDGSIDADSVSTLWKETFPQYPVAPQHLQHLLDQPWGSHFVASQNNNSSHLIGFCATYTETSKNTTATTAYLPIIIIRSDFQNRGYGTALLQHSLDHLWKSFKTVKLGCPIPKFWPGVPSDLNGNFFAKRGFKNGTACKDMYQQLATFKAPQYILDRASSSGVTFTSLTPSGIDECIAAQESKFPQWAGGYRLLHAENQHDDIMVALDHDGKQIGWTLMLSPGRSRLWHGYAFLPIAGGPDGNISGSGRTALIAAVGVSEEARGKGVGLGLICAAMEEMKKRGGIDGVFIDSVGLDNFYEKVGFETWKDYVDIAIEH